MAKCWWCHAVASAAESSGEAPVGAPAGSSCPAAPGGESPAAHLRLVASPASVVGPGIESQLDADSMLDAGTGAALAESRLPSPASEQIQGTPQSEFHAFSRAFSGALRLPCTSCSLSSVQKGLNAT